MGKQLWRQWVAVVGLLLCLGVAIADGEAASRRSERRSAADLAKRGSFVVRDPAFDSVLSRSRLPTRARGTTWTIPETKPEVESAMRRIANLGVFRSFALPLPGERGLGIGADSSVPRAVRDSYQRLERDERIAVSWNYSPDITISVLHVGTDFQLTKIRTHEPRRPGTTVTVLDGVAYIEDRSDTLDLPVKRFALPVDENFRLNELRWWEVIRGAVAQADEVQVDVIENGARFRSDRGSIEVTDANRLTRVETQYRTFEISSPSPSERIMRPSWAESPESIPQKWDDVLPIGRPDWLDHVVVVTRTADPPTDAISSGCGMAPYTPIDGIEPLPTGAEFVCQIDLARVPPVLGLPSAGLLQFFVLNEYESGFVRYWANTSGATHDPVAASRLQIHDFVEPTMLTFSPANTASWQTLSDHAPATFRYQRGPDGAPRGLDDADFQLAMAERSVDYVSNDVNMMGGRWDGNGATGPDFTRLLMVSDDTGYFFWHIPKDDLAVGRFDRVVGGWTD
jgi:hypothetical protein